MTGRHGGPPAPALLSTRRNGTRDRTGHLLGLLPGTEDDWATRSGLSATTTFVALPRAFEEQPRT
ncbi:hypothetical protein [Actinocrispum sp. NPDC049592]|uniref:hypothetical protein n=1 Tax=Actinocrispum sp. NPDC049592 TaxID=3154835 RepID=UPI0034487310